MVVGIFWLIANDRRHLFRLSAITPSVDEVVVIMQNRARPPDDRPIETFFVVEHADATVPYTTLEAKVRRPPYLEHASFGHHYATDPRLCTPQSAQSPQSARRVEACKASKCACCCPSKGLRRRPICVLFTQFSSRTISAATCSSECMI